MARILDVTRNFGPARGIIDFTVQNLTQTYTPLPNLDLKQLPGWEDPDKEELESSLLCWHDLDLEKKKHIDAGECANFTKSMQMFTYMLERYGEVFVTAEYLDPGTATHSHRLFGTAIMFINPLRVRTPLEKKYDKNGNRTRIEQGVEYNKYGKPIAYYVYDDYNDNADCLFFEPSGKKPYRRIPTYGEGKLSHRRQMMHFFEKNEDGDQIRGVSPFAATVENLELWRQLLKDIALRAQKQTKTTGIFTTDCDEAHDPNGPPILGNARGDAEAMGDEWLDPFLADFVGCGADHQKFAKVFAHHKDMDIRERMAKAGIDDFILYPTEDYKQLPVDNGSLAASELLQSLIDSIAAGHGYSTNQVLRNYTDGNYSGQRSGRIDTVRTLERKKCMTDDFAQSLWKLIGEEAIDRGRLELPKSVISRLGLNTPEKIREYVAENIDPLFRHEWAMPAPKIIEMEKDAKGFEKMIAVGGMTSVDVAAESGQTIESIQAKRFRGAKAVIDTDCKIEQYRIDKQKEVKGGVANTDDLSGIKTKMDAYGVAVRAGAVTPQPEDEVQSRLDLDLPPMSQPVIDCWEDVGNVQRPITLKGKTQLDAEQEVLDDKTDTPKGEDTSTADAEVE